MALLRNRPVTIVGPVIAEEVSPIYTVQYADGTKENTPLKFIQMTDAEFKEFKKTAPNYSHHIRILDDKEHQDVLDKQNPQKIRNPKAAASTPVAVPAQQSKTAWTKQ